MQTDEEKPLILYMSTFPPRKCGLATFTYDLSTAVNKVYNGKVGYKILAMNREDDSFD